jgi:hypothetical protein
MNILNVINASTSLSSLQLLIIFLLSPLLWTFVALTSPVTSSSGDHHRPRSSAFFLHLARLPSPQFQAQRLFVFIGEQQLRSQQLDDM